MIQRSLLGGLVLLLILTGCKMGRDYQGVNVESPSFFRYDLAQADTVVNLKWWELFDDPVLDSLIRLALAENRNVQIAARNIEQAGYVLAIQKAELLPKFNASANVRYGNNVGVQLDKAGYTFLGGAVVNWEFDFWGKYRRLREAAQAELLASEYGLRALQIDLVAQVTSVYFQLLAFHSQLEISYQTLALRDSTLKLIEERFEKGIVAEIDLNQAQIQRAIAASAIPVFKRAIGQTEHALSILVGVNPGAVLQGRSLEEQVLPPDIPPGIPASILTRRPDILAAEQFIIAQNARIGVAQAQRMPAISLTGLLGVASGDLASVNGFAWNVGGTLLGPLFHFGQNLRRVEIEKSRTEQAYLDYEQTVLVAFREVEDALVAIQTLKEEIVAREAHVAAALNAQRLSEQRYDRGVTSYLEYLESQRQAFDAQIFLAEARRDLLIAYINLYKVLGGGWMGERE